MVVNFIRKCCWLLGSQLSVGQYNAIAIAIAIVGSRSGCSCCGIQSNPIDSGALCCLALPCLALFCVVL